MSDSVENYLSCSSDIEEDTDINLQHCIDSDCQFNNSEKNDTETETESDSDSDYELNNSF